MADTAIKDRILPGTQAQTRVPGAPLSRWWSQERQQEFLWLPVILGVGIGHYFTLPSEPALVACFYGLALLVTLWWGTGWLKAREEAQYQDAYELIRKAFIIMMIAAAGLTLAKFRTMSVAAPIVLASSPTETVSGRLESITRTETGHRMVLRVSEIGRNDTDMLPEKVRLTWRGVMPTGAAALSPGDFVEMRAVLLPPPAPVAPGAYDYARHLYYQQIGGVGYAVTQPYTVEKGAGWSVEKLRIHIRNRILKSLPEHRQEAGDVAVALVTGIRDGINEETQSSLRDSGLAHLLAISGLHMGLVTGTLFFVSRFLFACFPPLALKYPVKKWAAVIALAGGLAYLVLSGASWSARRAFIMAALFFIAILLDRRALSLRNVAIAALIILIMTPEALVHAGFQMSFAAVTALIAAWEWAERKGWTARLLYPEGGAGPLRKLLGWVLGLGMTSLIAGFATGPFAAWHFHRAALYGLAGNLLAMPVVTFLIMPLALAGLLLMPIGLDGIAWRLMAEAIALVLWIGGEVAGWPGAVGHLKVMPGLFLTLALCGGLILTLMRSPLRLAGLPLLAGAWLLSLNPVVPSVFISEATRNIAIRLPDEDGGQSLVFQTLSSQRFAAENWIRMSGSDLPLDRHRQLHELYRPGSAVKCRESGCHVQFPQGQRLTISYEPEDLPQACAESQFVIARFFLPPSAQDDPLVCAARIVDKRFVAENGASVLYFGREADFRMRTSLESRGDRPWVLYDRQLN